MSFRGKIVAALIRPNKLIYRIFRPSARFVRFYVHPQAWLGGKFFSPFGISIKRTKLAGVPTVTFQPKKNLRENTLIVYFHGGGYCFGSSLTTHRLGLAHLAKITGITTHSVDYRLAPEHPYPAALNDAENTWKEIVKNNPESKIILSGDSAGGGLCLALMLKLRDNGDKMPDAAVLFSPWSDLTCQSETYHTKAKADPMFSPKMPIECSKYYAPNPIDKTEPYISPAFGDLSNLPRTLIIAGGNEILLGDSLQIKHNAESVGAKFELEIWPEMFHDWWLFGTFIPETRQCLNKVSEWI